MFKKIANKIILIVSAVNLIILSACSSVSNLTPHKVVESDNGVYTLTMAASLNDNSAIRGSERPYIVIDGQKHLMKTVLNLRNEVMYQYDYTFPKSKEAVSYYYVVDYKARLNHGSKVEDKSLDSGEMFVLRPLTKFVSGLKVDKAFVGSVVSIDGIGFDRSDVVLVGGEEAQTRVLSKKTLEFTVPVVSTSKTYDVEVKNKSGNSSWAGSLLVRPRSLKLSPSKISRDSGQTVNMIFDIGFKAPEGGFLLDVRTNIPSSVIMPEIIIAEGESTVVVPVKFAAAGTGFLFINAGGFGEKVVPVQVNEIATTELDLLNAQEDEISKDALNAKQEETEEVVEIAPEETVETEETVLIQEEQVEESPMEGEVAPEVIQAPEEAENSPDETAEEVLIIEVHE